MKISNIELNLSNFTKGGPVILTDFRPAYNYKDGKRVDTELVGRKAVVVLPSNNYDTLTVTVSDPVDAISTLLARATAENPLYVDFVDFTAKVYVMNGSAGISAKATAIRVVSAPGTIDDDDDILIE